MRQHRYSSLLEWPLRLARIATIAFIGATAAVLIVAVFFRYGLNNSIRWSEEVARALMIWMTFTAIPLAWRKTSTDHDQFVRVDLAVRVLPPRIALLIEALCLLAILVFLLVLGWNGMELALRSARQYLASVQISYFWIYLSVPVGCALMCLVTFERMLLLLRKPSGTVITPAGMQD